MSSSTQNNLTDAELAAYHAKKASWFKGTIAVCVVYGVFAIGLLAIALLDVRGRQLLSEDFLPFTITFVAGMIVVIILLVIQITSFKPQGLKNLIYDRETCPDYWKAVPATQDEMRLGSENEQADQYLKKIKCIPDPDVFALNYKWDSDKFAPITLTAGGTTVDKNVFNHNIKNDQQASETYDPSKNKYYVTSSASPSDLSLNTKLFSVAQTMHGNIGIGTTAMRCDVLFPALMAKEDEKTYPDNPNQLRCEYANLCGINWSTVC